MAVISNDVYSKLIQDTLGPSNSSSQPLGPDFLGCITEPQVTKGDVSDVWWEAEGATMVTLVTMVHQSEGSKNIFMASKKKLNLSFSLALAKVWRRNRFSVERGGSWGVEL